jgi:hypothetical protein
LVGQIVKLGEFSDRAIDGNRIDKIREAARCRFLDRNKSSGGAVALKRPNVARQPRIVKPTRDIFQ